MTRARLAPRQIAAALTLLLALAPAAAAQIPTPEASFGFRMGADGQLADWPAIQRYFELVAAASDRVELVDVGPTTAGRRLIAAIVSAPENIRRLPAIQAANRQLADPRTLDEAAAARLIPDHRIVLAIGCSIHATEVGASQAANELLYDLATATDERTTAILREVVLILFPSLNPDGHALVVDWHRQTTGTPFEAAPMPWLYHKYVGHDINRDAFMLNMVENRNLARFFYREWHPQVFLTMHQMGPRGPRFFVPPNYDPIDPNYDPIIWREAGLLGHAMALELERDGRSGVVSNALFDYYWPGYEDSAPLGHNTVCLLTEVASARLALPIQVPPGELSGSPRGLPEYRPQINFPNPWPGGVWRLRDIVEYDLSAVRGLLGAAARYRDELVRNFYLMGRRAIEKGRTASPFAFVFPPEQHDPHAAAKLANLLIEGGVEVERAETPFRAGDVDYPAGSAVVLMAQPFRAYAKTLLERQDYPMRRISPSGPPERPYDVAGWTLPLQMGVAVARIDAPFDVPAMARLERAEILPAQVSGDPAPAYYVIHAAGNGGALAANRLRAAGLEPAWTTAPIEIQGSRYAPGSLVVGHSRQARAVVERLAADLGLRASGMRGRLPTGLLPVGSPRVALYKPWIDNIDEGWTRWLLERYEFPFQTITDEEIRRGRLRERFDVIILPDAAPERLASGHRAGAVPPEFVGGLGTEGTAALAAFVRDGGTLVCLDSSGLLAIDALDLPVRDVTRSLPAEQFFCPGSILALDVDPSHPLAFGLPARTAAFFAYSSAYELRSPQSTGNGHGGPAATGAAQIVGRYASDPLLLSGWLEGAQHIAGRSAVVEARAGRGRVVLLGFRAQHRAQSHATFRLLFNAILTTGR